MNSTGLNYTSCHRVEADEDIISRFRSLLLSRNDRCPPRTPHTSDEYHQRTPSCVADETSFDFGTAVSIKKSTRKANQQFSLPAIKRSISSRASSIMGSRRATEPDLEDIDIIPPPIRPTSVEDLRASALAPPLESFPPKKRFRLPKLVLQDVKKPSNEIFSCIEIDRNIPEDDKRIHEEELICCPPCDPRDSKPSKYIINHPTNPGPAIRASPEDLACFLAGCPPGLANCKKHQRRRGSTTYVEVGRGRNIGEDFKGVAEGLSYDLAKLGLVMKGINVKTPSIASAEDGQRQVNTYTEPGNTQAQSTNRTRAATTDRELAKGALSLDVKTTLSPPAVVSPTSSQASMSFDRFPHALQSQERAETEGQTQLSTTVITNFNLPAAKLKRGSVKDALRNMPARLSKASNKYEPINQSRSRSNSRPRHRNQRTSSEQYAASYQEILSTIKVPSEEALPEIQDTHFTPSEVPDVPSNELVRSNESSTSLSKQAPELLIRSKLSDTSLKAKPKSPSLLSGASRKSVKHALLRPSVTPTQPVDTGLPIPPILTPLSSIVGQVGLGEPATEALKHSGGVWKSPTIKPDVSQADGIDSGRQNDTNDLPEPAKGRKPTEAETQTSSNLLLPTDINPVVSNINNLQKALNLVDTVKHRIEAAQNLIVQAQELERGKNAQDIRSVDPDKSAEPSSYQFRVETDSVTHIASQNNIASPSAHSLANYEQPSPEEVQQKSISRPFVPNQDASKAANDSDPTAANALNAAYWGFVPAVKDAVQDAVRLAVQNAVQDVIIPPGSQKAAASDAYRKLVANSLSEAAQIADQYLSRASLWNEPATSQRVSESTVLKGPTSEQILQETTRRSSTASKGQENEVQHGIARVSGAIETVPLEFGDVFAPGSERPSWKVPKAFKKRSSAGYAPIPDRRSSKNQGGILSPKNRITNSSTPVNVIGATVSRKRSFDRAVSRASRGLRSVSSCGSLSKCRSNDLDYYQQQLVSSEQDRNPKNDHSSISQGPSEELVGRKPTIQWVKDLLSTNDPYETRFTALPPRTRGIPGTWGPIRSNTAPMKPISELFLDATPRPQADKIDALVKRRPRAEQQRRTEVSETFTKTINDLENLMNEALFIARQAAESQDNTPEILHNAAQMLKSGRLGASTEDLKKRIQSRSYRESDEASSVPSVHESLRSLSDTSYSDSSSNEAPETQPLTRTITINLKQQARKSSGWPPTGRVSTPFPPASRQASQNPASKNNEIPHNIMSADPRSLPTETNVETRRRRTASMPGGPQAIRDALEQRSNSVSAADSDDYSDAPEFRTLDPFTGKPLTDEERRRSSQKSPKRLSPTKRSHVVPTDPGYESPTENDQKLGDLPLDMCGGPIPHPLPKPTPRGTLMQACPQGHTEDDRKDVRSKLASKAVPNKSEVRQYIKEYHHPPIALRTSSRSLRKRAQTQAQPAVITSKAGDISAWQNIDRSKIKSRSQASPEANGLSQVKESPSFAHSLDGTIVTQSEEVDFNTGYRHVRQRGGGEPSRRSRPQDGIELQDIPDPNLPQTNRVSRRKQQFSLRNKTHVSLKEHHLKGFSLSKSHKRQTIARDWSPARKRFVASVACLSTALIGILVGIYAGITPAIQYYIVDFHHYTVLGNVFFFIGLAIPTFFFWPLPLLHGRKPYILGAMSLAMPLLFPQALAVGSFRSPYVSTYRVGLLMSRALMGFCLGFANMNFKSMLTDLFGASLMATNPHQEHADEFDVRRHGGGMGIWLGLWTWSALGSIGFGFMLGAIIINSYPPAWGFYVSIIIIAIIMLLNVLCPEPRRSAFRRSVAEVATHGGDVSRRLARGEVKMHMTQTGPKWWGEEFHWGVQLTSKMLRQPGFMLMALYTAWIYGQQVLIIVVSHPDEYPRFR